MWIAALWGAIIIHNLIYILDMHLLYFVGLVFWPRLYILLYDIYSNRRCVSACMGYNVTMPFPVRQSIKVLAQGPVLYVLRVYLKKKKKSNSQSTNWALVENINTTCTFCQASAHSLITKADISCSCMKTRLPTSQAYTPTSLQFGWLVELWQEFRLLTVVKLLMWREVMRWAAALLRWDDFGIKFCHMILHQAQEKVSL